MPISMRCVDPDLKGETWTLDLASDLATVRDAAGQSVATMTPEQAVGSIALPAFGGDTRYVMIALGDRARSFDIAKADLKQVKAFFNQTIAAAGPEVVAAFRNRAIRDTLIGLGAAGLGVAVTVGTYMEAASNPNGGRYTVTWGLVLFGVIMLARGLHGFVRHANLRRLSDEALRGRAQPTGR